MAGVGGANAFAGLSPRTPLLNFALLWGAKISFWLHILPYETCSQQLGECFCSKLGLARRQGDPEKLPFSSRSGGN